MLAQETYKIPNSPGLESHPRGESRYVNRENETVKFNPIATRVDTDSNR